jgi:hypothetical protein
MSITNVNIRDGWEFASDGKYHIDIHLASRVVLAQKRVFGFLVYQLNVQISKEDLDRVREMLKYDNVHEAYCFLLTTNSRFMY